MELEERGLRVISVMEEIPELSHLPLDALKNIPLGRLRKGSTRRHGVCRWNRGAAIDINDIKAINIHPDALNERWSRYADKVLYHEFLHALGFYNHDDEFYRMEELWSDAEAFGMKRGFSDFLMDKYCKWELACPSCELRDLRSRRPKGRYFCKKCKSVMDCLERELPE